MEPESDHPRVHEQGGLHPARSPPRYKEYSVFLFASSTPLTYTLLKYSDGEHPTISLKTLLK